MRALLIVDLQQDFLPGGALPVPKGDEIISIINALQKNYELVIASKDWHPIDHCSFDKDWPPHCVQGTPGADFPKELNTEKIKATFTKGYETTCEAYSAFKSPGLLQFLRQAGVQELDIVGLATEFCVKATALDAVTNGFMTRVIAAACRGIGPNKSVFKEMEEAGISIVHIVD